jgi:hypothetical protein
MKGQCKNLRLLRLLPQPSPALTPKTETWKPSKFIEQLKVKNNGTEPFSGENVSRETFLFFQGCDFFVAGRMGRPQRLGGI